MKEIGLQKDTIAHIADDSRDQNKPLIWGKQKKKRK
jgi:hypothetical protein